MMRNSIPMVYRRKRHRKREKIITMKIPLSLSKELDSLKFIPREAKYDVIARLLKKRGNKWR